MRRASVYERILHRVCSLRDNRSIIWSHSGCISQCSSPPPNDVQPHISPAQLRVHHRRAAAIRMSPPKKPRRKATRLRHRETTRSLSNADMGTEGQARSDQHQPGLMSTGTVSGSAGLCSTEQMTLPFSDPCYHFLVSTHLVVFLILHNQSHGTNDSFGGLSFRIT